jgi:hypothetical protein
VDDAAEAGLWLELLLSYPLHGRACYAAYFSSNPATQGRSEWPVATCLRVHAAAGTEYRALAASTYTRRLRPQLEPRGAAEGNESSARQRLCGPDQHHRRARSC